MRTLYTILSATLIAISGFSQTDTVFYSENWQKSEISTASFYRIINRKDSIFVVNDFDITGIHLMEGTYNSIDPEIENGDFIFYYPTGKIQAEGSFSEGEIIGIWKFYNAKGKISKKLDYSKKTKTNPGLKFSTENGNDSVEYSIVKYIPQFQNGGTKKFTEYLYTNFNMPIIPEKYNISGTVFIQFFIDKKGNMVNPRIQQSIHPHIDCEIKRIIANAPKWKPAIHNGQLINFGFTIPFDVNK